MMETRAWMAYFDSTHFSDKKSYMTFLIWTYRLNDMILGINCKKKRKKVVVARGLNSGQARVEGKAASHRAGSVFVKETGSRFR